MSFQYRGLKGVIERHEVTKAEVDHRLHMLATQNPRIVLVEDRPTQNGDEVILDYAGFCGGVQFPGGTAEMQSLVLGSNTFIPGFEDQLLNHNVGDEVSVKVMFPAQYHAPDLAGKAAEFRCKIHQIRKKVDYEMDDLFAQEMGGCETFEEFHKMYWEMVQKNADNQSEMELQDQLLQKAVETMDYEPTEEEIAAEVGSQMEALKAQLAQRGLNLEMYCQFMRTNEEKLRADARGNAVKSLKGQAAIDRIVELEKIEMTAEEREAALVVICRQNNMDLEQLRPYIDEEFEAAIRRSVLMGKVMSLIREAAEVTEG